MAISLSMITGVRLALIPLLVLLFVKNTEGIRCLECNAFFQGRRGRTCDEPQNRTSCVGCLKVITKVQINNGWLLRKTSDVVTRYCARVSGSSGLKDEGCYYQQNNGGYTQRCYCYSDGCNKATQLLRSSSLWTYGVLSLGLCALLMR